MNGILTFLFGKLSLDAIPREPVTLGAAIGMSVTVLILAGVLTYYKRWKWLWREWLTTTDHKRVGVMYLAVSGTMLLRGIADAIMLRAQQATSVGDTHALFATSTFQQVFSAHGTIMIFFVAMGFMFGLINIVLPQQLGARDVAFPFMNAASFWLFAVGMIMVNTSLVVGGFSAAGWLSYPPLSEVRFSPGVGVDYWIWSLQISGLGSLLSGINFLVTILKMRCKGMTFMRMPMFAWSVLASMSLVVFAFPILTATLAMLALDRTFGMHFFTAGAGGNAMMYVNLIWAWGHPEVYILVLPAFGIFSEVVATFSGKRLFGYASMVWAIWAIVILSFGVWLHHFFTMGAGADVNAVFGIATMLISIPTGVKVFNWLFTMYRGRVRLTSPMVWFLGFVFLFIMGGVAGVMMAVPAIDFQVHNSLFLVAHFHTMIISGVLFGYFAGFTYWFPKIFGFTLHEKLGTYAAWCWMVGFALAFGPLYILGLMGATRRLDHYDASTGWQSLFIVAAVGVGVICVGVGLQVLQLVVSIIQRKKLQDVSGDPWDARTLEWATGSPTPFYDFAIEPTVTERDAFWEAKQAARKPKAPHYEPIHMPINTPAGIFIGAFAMLFGFGFVWHIWWAVGLGLIGAITTIIIRTSNEHTERLVSVAEITAIEDQQQTRKRAL